MLNLNLAETDTSRPILPKGRFPFLIKDVSFPENKAKTGINMLIIFALLEEVEGYKEGSVCNKGFQVRRYYPLQQSENPNAPPFERDIALLVDAANSIDDPADRPHIKSEDQLKGVLLDRNVLCSIDVEDSEQYGLGNSVKQVNDLEQ